MDLSSRNGVTPFNLCDLEASLQDQLGDVFQEATELFPKNPGEPGGGVGLIVKAGITDGQRLVALAAVDKMMGPQTPRTFIIG